MGPMSKEPTTFTGTDRTFYDRLFASIAEEMGSTLARTASSPNIVERRDFSCALFDPEGRLIAQAAHIPVHLGALPLSMQAILDVLPEDGPEPDDIYILNDPYAGGTHLPDITLASPVFEEAEAENQGTLAAWLVTRAHHADVGGMSPGSPADPLDRRGRGAVVRERAYTERTPRRSPRPTRRTPDRHPPPTRRTRQTHTRPHRPRHVRTT